jgi:hypothetical protein
MVALTELFWYWSGMASLGVAYLMLLAPVVMAILAVMLYRQRRLSRYHFGSFIASVVYPCVVLPMLVFFFVRSHP